MHWELREPCACSRSAPALPCPSLACPCLTKPLHACAPRTARQATGSPAAREIHYSKVENKDAANLAEVSGAQALDCGAGARDAGLGCMWESLHAVPYGAGGLLARRRKSRRKGPAGRLRLAAFSEILLERRLRLCALMHAQLYACVTATCTQGARRDTYLSILNWTALHWTELHCAR